MKSHKNRKKNPKAKAVKSEASTFEPSAQEISAVMALISQGRCAEVVVLAQALTSRFPLHEFGWKVLAGMLHTIGKSNEALLPMMIAVTLVPNDVEAHSNLSSYFKDMGRFEEAEASCLRALEIDPEFIDGHINLVAIFIELGRSEEAFTHAQMLTERFPSHGFGWKVLGAMLHSFGKSSEALSCLMMAVTLLPNDAEAHNNLGRYFMQLGRLNEAEDSCRRALEINPEYFGAYLNLSCVFIKLGRYVEAEGNCYSALKYNDKCDDAYANLGLIFGDTGRDSDPYFKKALEIRPDKAEIHSNRLYYLSMSAKLDTSALFTEHLHYAEQFETPLIDHWQAHKHDRNPYRILQIGFVSGDLCNHALATFIEPLLIHLSKFSSLTLHAYANHAVDDDISERLQGYFSYWTSAVGLSETELANKIRADNIDILVDLSGHTAHNRLLTFARKPAPIQASWMGYPGTTGLQAMDYYLADRFFLPQEPFKDQFTEKLVYLPASAPFMPYEAAPDVNELPALTKGYITFGSFNRLNKLSSEVIAVWAKLMLALPTSRLILAAMPESGYDTVINWFAEQGIEQERLILYPKRSMGVYMTLHHQVDMCLDTFPYNGGTTTCHALWMGVPTLTLAGQTPASRSGATILSHAGLDDIIADNMDDFVNKGLSLANDLEVLAQLRMVLRTRFRLSAKGQPELIAKGLEQAFHLMWQRWCDDLPPIMLDVTDTQISTVESMTES